MRRPRPWVVRHVRRVGWFTTEVRWDLQDGTTARWDSRTARRRGRIHLHSAEGAPAGAVEAEPVAARRLIRLNLTAAVSFVLGGSLFAVGAYLAQAGIGSTRTVDVVYLVGGVFFSLGGYVSVLQATNAPTVIDETGSLSSPGWRWWLLRGRDIGWASAAVLFVGTLFFAVSLLAAFAQDLTPRQSDGWIWLPDIVGCVCFLVSGHLAMLEIGHGRVTWRPGDLGWWIVAVNQLGSVLFFLAGLAAFVRPTTSAEINAGLVNWGTCAGAVGFVIGGVLQMFEKPTAPSG
ncbi:hypothetical protein FE697_007585 [Mumia zhuanghuii]|uniref:YrhK domain-containing protein n=1 Tax=Mumia zhuanghuii TaxID=2585211 RepID=A0A5Q6S0S1_9ACTN|nr:hypothetical protein FE697_007585 [Mumia zhuanghuii]